MPHRKRLHALTAELLDWFSKNARDLPWRRTRDPYAIWISEIMLQQTQVKTVLAYWERWLAALPDARAFARADSAKIHKLWEGLGYYTRVRNAQVAARLIVEQHGGEFPRRFDQVLALPGVGRYTAGAICSIAFNQPTPILDGNVMRVLSRIFGVPGDPRGKEANAQLWKLAEELVTFADSGPAAERSCGKLNESLMELGALVCTPAAPKCPGCPVARHCFARRQNRVSEFPAAKATVKPTQRHFVAFIIEREGRFLVRQRPDNVVNAHLWEFPNEEISTDKKPPAALPPFVITGPRPICRVRHSITRYRILVEAFKAECPNDLPGAVWRTPVQLHRLAFTSAHRKILNAAVGGTARLEPRPTREKPLLRKEL